MSKSFVFYYILALGLLLALSGNISKTLSSPSSLSNYIFDRNIPQDGIEEIKIQNYLFMLPYFSNRSLQVTR